MPSPFFFFFFEAMNFWIPRNHIWNQTTFSSWEVNKYFVNKETDHLTPYLETLLSIGPTNTVCKPKAYCQLPV